MSKQNTNQRISSRDNNNLINNALDLFFRGNSKYHYYGIRVKPNSPLISLIEDGTSRQQQNSSQTKRFKFMNAKQEPSYETNVQTNTTITSNNSPPQYHQYLGETSGAIPDFPDIIVSHGSSLPDECTLEDIDTFRSIYREHCEAFLDAVLNFEFATVESLWREFWRSQDNNNGDECEEEKYLSKYEVHFYFCYLLNPVLQFVVSTFIRFRTKLYQMCKSSEVQDFIRRVDYAFYQNLVEVLMPDVLRPIPSKKLDNRFLKLHNRFQLKCLFT